MRLKEKSKEEKKRGKRKEKETEIGSHLKALLAHTKALYSGERERIQTWRAWNFYGQRQFKNARRLFRECSFSRVYKAAGCS